MPETPGIHHITAISGPAQGNVDFYVGSLGLSLVKKTVNFDDPGTYHLYYGDVKGRPGSILTFFPWRLAAPGRAGSGEVTATAFAVPFGSLPFWTERLDELDIRHDSRNTRFGQPILRFSNSDSMVLELIENAESADQDLSRNHLTGLHGATLSVVDPDPTLQVLTDILGMRLVKEELGRYRLRSAAEGPGSVIDVLAAPGTRQGRLGTGSVHHIAFRATTDQVQAEWRELLATEGFNVTEILDRNYFRSIYFREPGGTLFEIATDPPGFTVDEDLDRLGSDLKLPRWLETRREEILAALPELRIPSRR